MGFIGTIFHAIKDFYTWPFHLYKYNYNCDLYNKCAGVDHDWTTSIILGIAIAIGTIAVAWLLLMPLYWWAESLYKKYKRRRDSKPCVHCGQLTLQKSEGKYPNCPEGQACCEADTREHKKDAIKAEAEAQEKIPCPRPTCHSLLMEKVIKGSVIYDKCPSCLTIVIDEDEMEHLIDKAYHRGWMDHRPSSSGGSLIGPNYSLGLATGISIGSVL